MAYVITETSFRTYVIEADSEEEARILAENFDSSDIPDYYGGLEVVEEIDETPDVTREHVKSGWMWEAYTALTRDET